MFGMNKRKAGEFSVWENFRYVVAGAAKWQPFMAVCTILHGVAQGLSIYVWLYAVKLIIGIFESSPQPAAEIEKMLIIVGVAAVTELIMLVTSNICDKQAEVRMHDVRFHFVELWSAKMWTMPFVKHEDPDIQDDAYKAKKAFSDMANGIHGMHFWLSMGLPGLIAVAAAMAILFAISPAMVVIMTVLSVCRFLLINKAMNYEKIECMDKAAKELRMRWYWNFVTADFAFGKDIRLFRMQKPLYARMRRINEFLNSKTCLAQNMYARCYVAGDCLEFLEELIMYGWLVYMVLAGKLTIADFTLYLGSIRSFTYFISEAFTRLVQVNFASKYVSDYRRFLAGDCTKEELAARRFKDDYKDYLDVVGIKPGNAAIQEDGRYEFVFDRVSFRYPGSSQYALKNLSLTLRAGEKMAVVGLNGAGKSTFVKLLCRLYEPTEGKIYLNGRDIRTYPLTDYFQIIAPVFQEDGSFAFPIAQNVSMETEDKQDRELIYKCLCDAGLKEKIDELQAGIDTSLYKKLDDMGIELSGGQKQKLMLARALYKNAPVVVLDEPTAALDALAERDSYENFDKFANGRTTVYISHRLSSTRFCDNIAMFEAGELAEYGNHEELLQRKGKYAQLFEVQAQYYKEKGEAVC